MFKRVLVTGNLGYIGSVLVPMLKDRGYHVIGYDIGYYKDCLLEECEGPHHQILKDIREINSEELEGVDAIIHLAALSNDPLGELAVSLTEEINLGGTKRIADLAEAVGVKRFIYSSSQSMYGISRLDGELDEDNSEKNPVTAYARTKWEAECYLKAKVSEGFEVVCFRPSTVFGASPRFRSDIVFNNLVSCAYTSGKIEIKSDGSPWRPVVHVKDVSSAYIAGLEAPGEIISGRSYNVGIRGGNYRVSDLAKAAQQAVPGSELVFTGEDKTDARTYRVSFKRILTELKEWYKPEWDLKSGGVELREYFDRVGLDEIKFRGEHCVRLKRINSLIENGNLDQQLYMKQGLEMKVGL